MALKMHENSLFAVLLRSPWWAAALVAGGVFALIRAWFEWFYAAFAALPFAVIAGYVLWQQLRQPSAEKVLKKLEGLRALPAEQFAAALEAGFRREGWSVARVKAGAADLELTQGWRVALVSSKRWKAAHAGVEQLRELEALRKEKKAEQCVVVAAGELSEAARKFAAEKNFRVIDGAGLAKLVAGGNR
jgi:restriction system protein